MPRAKKLPAGQYEHYTSLDACLMLFEMVLLFIIFFSVSSIFFEILNRLMPIGGWYQYMYSGSIYSLRTSLSMLIVSGILYAVTTYRIQKIESLGAKMLASQVRHWLFSITLFILACIAMVDLIVVLQYLFAGDFTVRFTLKCLWVLLLSALAFAIYRGRQQGRAHMREVACEWISGAMILIVLVTGIISVGTPTMARSYQNDDIRISNMGMVVQSLLMYWNENNLVLPKSLNELKDPIRGISIPRDPLSNAEYEYIKKAGSTFQICAVFETDTLQEMQSSGSTMMNSSRPMMYDMPYNDTYEFWRHPKGHFCFDRTFDPKKHQMNK